MQADLPHTLFDRKKRKKDKKGSSPRNYKYNPNDRAMAKQMEANRRSKERREARGEKVEYTLDELFSSNQ